MDQHGQAADAGRWLLRPRAGGDAGGAIVEAALVFPFLVVLVFGVIDIGRAWSLKNKLTNMAREGGAYAQYFPTNVIPSGSSCADPANITARAGAEDPSVTGELVTVTNKTTGAVLTGCGTGTATSGQRVEVRVTKDMALLTPIARLVTGSSSLSVSGQIEMKVQG